MSLIINMLKDLEKREDTRREIPDISLTSNVSTLSLYSGFSLRSSRTAAIISGIISLIFIPLALYAFLHTTPVTVPHFMSNTQPEKLSNQETRPIDNTLLEATKINGITLSTTDNVTDIRFLLNQQSLYRVATTHTGNHVILTLENADLESELPSMDYLNMGILNISSRKIAKNMQFDITLKPGSFIKLIDISRQEKNPELGIKIETPAQKAPYADSSSSSEMVKKEVTQDILIQQYQAALATAQNGDTKKAIDHLFMILKNEKSYHRARASLVALLIETGNHYKAEQTLEAGIKLVPDYVPFIELKARLMAMKGDLKGALTLLQHSSPGMDEYPDYYAYIAALYERLNKNVMAANIYRQLLKLDTQNSSWWFGLGLSMDKVGNRQEALFSYNRALAQGKLDTVSLAYLQKRMQSLQEATHETD